MRLNFVLLFILISIIVKQMTAQIPNNSFEEWETIQNYNKPKYWSTNQDTNFIRFEKDTLAVEGKYSLKIIHGTLNGEMGCSSYAFTKVKLPQPVGEDQSLTFFVKTIPDDTLYDSKSVFIKVQGGFFASGNFISNYEWHSYEKIEQFTKIQIPFPNPNIDSFTIHIYGGSLSTAVDDCVGYSLSWIDDFKVAKTEKTSVIDKITGNKDIIIYPNPSNGIIKIKNNNGHFKRFQFYNLYGELLQKGKLYGDFLKFDVPQGLYLLKLTTNNKNNSGVIVNPYYSQVFLIRIQTICN